ncbi:Polyamine aminopropyltransferase [Mycolicibacterium vanbaalenii]|uniref:Polyamine aminopropyltransferase n=1 Tax=Mycolicibacterium vanbaalenii TaxID=110539 RepID=A0A5S9R486_MYCVN|nr:spermidine synthase [Mycolicibacterium vanbaalenii]CAA0127457.1 Polyamine aminopropyltransferase [Mycolicibacterium vanbaalenii]
MGARFEELGWQQTPMGQISLRRRFDLSVRTDVYEVKLDDEYVMSSLFTVAERELARLGLARTPGTDLDVVVGGLGLGYTAREALRCNRIRSLTVIEYSEAVIDWHQRDLLPDTAGLAADSRATLVRADFFAAATDPTGFAPEDPDRTYDAILLDIDHSPRHVLDPAHAAFYTQEGLLAAATRLVPGGTFALWSDDAPDDDFRSVLEVVFTDVEAQQVWFDNPLTGGRSANTVYLATRK